MLASLLFLHSCTRYAVVVALAYTTARALYGWLAGARYTTADDRARSITVSVVHVQFVLGIGLYFASPLIRLFFSDPGTGFATPELAFFSIIHAILMTIATGILTTGAARARRLPDDTARFRAVAISFLVATGIILLTIPWQFSPFVARPWLRPL